MVRDAGLTNQTQARLVTQARLATHVLQLLHRRPSPHFLLQRDDSELRL